MKCRLVSDLHYDINTMLEDLPVLPDDKDTVLLLPGDVCPFKRKLTFESVFSTFAEQFKHVIFVPGNHEYYKGSMVNGVSKTKQLIEDLQLDNVSLLDNDHIVIDDVLFIGSTLWTDFDKENPIVMDTAKRKMNDYNYVRTGPCGTPYQRTVTTTEILNLHYTGKRYLFDTIERESGKYDKVVVATHHGPTWESIAEIYRTGPNTVLNGCYASDLSNEILDNEDNIDVWVHGHTHSNLDYDVGTVKVLTNPKGYHNENPSFDPTFTIDLDNI